MNPEQKFNLNPSEELQLLQLQELKEWTARSAAKPNTGGSAGVQSAAVRSPAQWSLLQDTRLLPWQEEALERWILAGHRGIAKVVTGAGKTVFGLAAMERLQRNNPNLLVAIIVPTIVLMAQWQEEIVSRSPIAATMIGTLGGGADDKFEGSIRILICVLNSAARKLPDIVRHLSGDHELLMIVDECHRAGASEMRRIFETPRQFTLGLSATPERDDPLEDLDLEIDSYAPTSKNSNDVLQREIGPIFFEMTYAEAIEQGILPTFSVEHYALSLTSTERQKYEALSQEISDLRQQLETRSRRGLALIRWCRSAAGSKDYRSRRLIGLIAERKQFLYRIGQRAKAVERILIDALNRDPKSRVIIFHESIAEVMRIFARLRTLGFEVVAEHSEFSDRTRAQAISLFRQGTAQVIVSAKSLIEGFNVPSADIGIVVAASSSVRQRVQTLGRLLRRGTEDAKQARLIVLFAENTVDEMIYEKADWNGFVGAERNEYFHWPDVENTLPIQVAAAPREYTPADFELDLEGLEPGKYYPGKLEGDNFTVDTGGTVLDARNRPISLDAEIMARLRDFRGGGRFIVTPKRRYVVKLVRGSTGIEAVYLGQLAEPLKASTEVPDQIRAVPERGEHYPLELAVGKRFSVLQRDERLIARKDRGHASFVERPDKILDADKRYKLANIQSGLRDAYRKGHLISKIFVNELGHVGYLYQGQAYFLGEAPEGSAGFVFEHNNS